MDGSTPPRPGEPGGAGGGAPGGGRGSGGPLGGAFATGYKAHSGDMMVYGGGAITVLGVLAMALTGEPAFLILSVIGSLSALYFWPLVDTRVPQLGANAEGLYVARVGLIKWSAIRRLKVRRRALRTMRLASLIVEVDRPLAEALLEADRPTLGQRMSARNARVRGEMVEVTLHTLAMPVDAIEARLMALRPGH